MAMNGQHKTWGTIRRIFLIAGILAAVGAAFSFAAPSSISPFLYAGVALLLLCIPLLASDDLIHRIQRIFWRREWPK
jgi:hypothetical protein